MDLSRQLAESISRWHSRVEGEVAGIWAAAIAKRPSGNLAITPVPVRRVVEAPISKHRRLVLDPSLPGTYSST